MCAYAQETKCLFLTLMEAILESLGIVEANQEAEKKDILKDFEDGSQIMVVNYYPPCPEPDLTLGMPPHSDYGFLTLLLQDEVDGLQIQILDQWLTVDPIPNAFVVNVGDHLEVGVNSMVYFCYTGLYPLPKHLVTTFIVSWYINFGQKCHFYF